LWSANGVNVDNVELYSQICKLDSSVFKLHLDVMGRFWRVWFVMFLAFYFFTLTGLYVVHRECAEAVQEMRHEMTAAMHSSPSLQSEQVSANRPIPHRIDANSAVHAKTAE
jgi:hypothetical protein